MKYSPECVAAFEAKFPRPRNVLWNNSAGKYEFDRTGLPDWADAILASEHNARLEAFAANWERVRELEEAIAVHKLRFCGDKDLTKEDLVKEDRALWKLLEKGNEY